MKTIVFTGGGSGGHVMPALTLIKKIMEKPTSLDLYQLCYIGSYKGVERQLVSAIDIEYKAISTGKLRRYFSWQNFSDIFRLLWGFIQALCFLFSKLKKERILFSTGGFVSVPVVIAAKCLGYKIYIHEQTSRVGLANKIGSYFATQIFVSFEDSIKYFPKEKTVLSGYPLRDECFDKNIKIKKFKDIDLSTLRLPIIFITGGGNGSKLLNDFVKLNLESMTKDYLVIHQVGSGYIDEYSKIVNENYVPVDLVGSEMIDLFKLSELVISRSGAGTVCELRALEKRSIFIPLKIAQKNEQFFNAMENNKYLGSLVISEDELQGIDFSIILKEYLANKHISIDYNTNTNVCLNGTELVLKAIM